jgi:hypothetical protein
MSEAGGDRQVDIAVLELLQKNYDEFMARWLPEIAAYEIVDNDCDDAAGVAK